MRDLDRGESAVRDLQYSEPASNIPLACCPLCSARSALSVRQRAHKEYHMVGRVWLPRGVAYRFIFPLLAVEGDVARDVQELVPRLWVGLVQQHLQERNSDIIFETSHDDHVTEGVISFLRDIT